MVHDPRTEPPGVARRFSAQYEPAHAGRDVHQEGTGETSCVGWGREPGKLIWNWSSYFHCGPQRDWMPHREAERMTAPDHFARRVQRKCLHSGVSKQTNHMERGPAVGPVGIHILTQPTYLSDLLSVRNPAAGFAIT